jgi:hypothetical protein
MDLLKSWKAPSFCFEWLKKMIFSQGAATPPPHSTKLNFICHNVNHLSVYKRLKTGEPLEYNLPLFSKTEEYHFI